MPEQCQGSYVCIVNVNNNLRNVDAAVKGSLLDYAKNVSTFENVSTGENTADLPNNNARYCVANIMHRANSWFISIEGRDNRLYTNYNNGDSWTGWQATALKSDLANKTKSGSATISTKQNDSTALQIRFDEPFPSRPYVTVSLNTDNANTNTKISVLALIKQDLRLAYMIPQLQPDELNGLHPYNYYYSMAITMIFKMPL